MSTVEFHPWNSRRADTERPDEWRIDLDPMPRCGFDVVRRVARISREILDELGVQDRPKTAGGRGLPTPPPIHPPWAFPPSRQPPPPSARPTTPRAPAALT